MFKWILFLFALAGPLLADELPPQLAQTEAAHEDYQKLFNRTVTMVVVVIGMVILTIYLVKRMGYARSLQLNSSKHIKIIERRPISPKSILYLVQVANKTLVIAESQVNVKEMTTFERELDE
ncbi:MAG: flagellar biosynthetic protein FliO [Simkaniaceae bacterium]|nr:flagellar biosynthetic protein FliO [Simkaniaceae bacterium]